MFSKHLIETISDWKLLKHPFYQAWMEGTLTKEQLQNYAIQYYPHVEAFPRYVSSIHSLCEDLQARKALAQNLADEEGLSYGESHPELWLHFAEGLGVTKDKVFTATPSLGSKRVVETFFKFSRTSYGEGLAALFAYELQVPDIAATKIEGLRKFYGIESERTLKFFEVHKQADIYHSESCAQALDKLHPSDQKGAENAAITSCKVLWGFLSEAYEST